MMDEWFWKHHGETRGPISTADLDDLIQHHRIDNRDELRPVNSTEWISGETVKAMFAGAQETENATVDAAARLLQQKRIPGSNTNSTSSATTFGENLAGAAKSTAGLLSGVLDLIITGISTALFSLRRLYSPWLMLGVAVLILISIPLSLLDVTGAETRRIYHTYSQILEEARQLHSEEAAEAEWDRLRMKYQNEVKASQSWMKQAALKYAPQWRSWQWDFEATNYLARRKLIQLSYAIEEILSGSKARRTKCFIYVDESYAAATDAIRGKTLEHLKAQTVTARKSPKPAESKNRLDPTIAGILVIDGLLLIGGGFFVRRRLIRR